MKYVGFLVLYALLATRASGQAVIQPPAPVLSVPEYPSAALPVSEINIPVQVDLSPFFALANKKVDTLFTSPGFPGSWVQQGCDTRYQYSFRRGPLEFTLKNTRLDISFTGYYKILGSTRACVNGKPLRLGRPPAVAGLKKANAG